MPKVSVMIPVYNGENFIKESIMSVLAQTYTDYEIIVINDGSTDKSEKILTPYIKKGIIRYFYQDNQGFANAKNRAIRESEGEYIAWLDYDDVWLPNRLSKTVNIMDKDKNTVVVGSYCGYIDENGKKLPLVYPYREKGVINFYLFPRNKIMTGSALIRKSVLLENDLWFEQQFFPADDYHMWLKLSFHGKMIIIPEILYHYRIHGNNSSIEPGVGINKQTIRKHWQAAKEILGVSDYSHLHCNFWKRKILSYSDWINLQKDAQKLYNLYKKLSFFSLIDKIKISLYYDAFLWSIYLKNKDIFKKNSSILEVISSLNNPALYFSFRLTKLFIKKMENFLYANC